LDNLKHNPRLPELAGMTEAGFNRVVAMIDVSCFMRRHFCDPPWGALSRVYCSNVCQACMDTLHRYNEWRASLPKTRNKKQRKAANVPRWTEEDIRKMHEPSAAIDAFFELANSVPVVDGPLASRVDLLKGGG
jgi:hypothetical protein